MSTEIRKTIRNVLTEAAKDKLEFNCLMVDVKFPEWDNLLKMFEKNDIYDKPEFGLEKNPHITVLYGLHDDTDYDKLKKIVNKTANKEVKFETNNITHFKSKDYDVVKLDIDSKTLNALNAVMKKSFNYTSDFPNYHPHMTLGYVKKGLGEKYDKKMKNIELSTNKFIYSFPNGKKLRFSI